MSETDSITKSSVRKRDVAMQDGVTLKFKQAFGVNGPIRDNVMFVRTPDDFSKEKEVLMYPVGQKVAMYSPEDGKQTFLNGDKRNSNARSVLGLAQSPNKKFIAVCEKCGPTDGAQVSVFYISTCNRIRTMIFPSKGDFSSVVFSGDSKMLVTVSEAPDSQLVVWAWEKEKISMSTNLTSKVTRISCSAFSTATNLQITATGHGYLRLWTVAGGTNLKQQALVSQAQEHENFTDHCWLTSSKECMAAVTEGSTGSTSRTASILLFRTTEEAPFLELQKKIPVLLRGKTRLECIANYGKGFILGGTNGFFSVYEKNDDRKDPYMLIKTFYYQTESFYSICASANDEQVSGVHRLAQHCAA